MAIIDNTASEIGDVIIVISKIPNEGISELSSYIDVTEDETGTKFFDRKFRYSIDGGASFTDFIELSLANVDGLEIDGSITDSFVIEYHYTRAGIDPSGTLAFNSVSLNGLIKKSSFSKLFAGFQRLYPKGTAFGTPNGSNRQKYQLALAKSENRLFSQAIEILDSILPDNTNFTEENATAWEKRLAIPSGDGTDLEDRKLAILRKYQYPGTQKARGNAVWIERELQAAGFDVYVHENRFLGGGGNYFSKSYQEVVGITGNAVHSPLIQHGQIQHGTSSEQKVVNSIDPAIDNTFDVLGNFERTFFVGGANIGTFASIPVAREVEFRKLILELKPTQTVAWLLITKV